MLEILVAASGLALGYWLVSVFLSSPKPSSGAEPGNTPEPEPYVVDIGARHWSEVLELPADADEAQITAAYRRRISEYHPDRVAMMAEEIRMLASERTVEINAAYEQAMRHLRQRTRSCEPERPD